jgi:pimeloyl-ACP methyl ester carboxylesterase
VKLERLVSEEDIIKAGITAIKSGDLTRAASLFAQIVKENPSSERGWFLLGMSCATLEQREYCLRRVLAINPNHSDARQQLTNLAKPAPTTSVPAWTKQDSKPFVSPPKPQESSPFVSTPNPSVSQESNPFVNAPKPQESSPFVKPQKPQESSPFVNVPKPTAVASPFVFDDMQDKAEKVHPMVPAVEEPAHKPDQFQKRQPKKKKINNVIVLVGILSVLILIVSGLGVVYLLLSARTTRLTSPGAPVAVASSTVPATYTPVIVSTPTLTLVPPLVLPSPLPIVAYQPLFESAKCKFDIPKGADVKCGYVIVPEDRTGDPAHTIKLAVAVYLSKSKTPQTEPVMFLQGGPGAEAVKLSADAYDVLVSPFLSERDFVVFDQRGTGLSEPVLNCDELNKTYAQDIHGLIPAATRDLVYPNAFISCNGLMIAQGVKLNAYTTFESAADVKDVLGVLGYQKVNLYGASYGTRLAQVVMREYPEIVQSAILDSVVPIETSLFKGYPISSESALKALFDTCKSSPKCDAAYPNLETVFWGLVSKLDANPITVTSSTYPIGTVTESMTGSSFMSVVLGSIKNSSFISTAPQTIHRFEMGDYSTLIAAQYSLPFAFDGISPGLYISMMCHEHILTNTLEELQGIGTLHGVKDYDWLPFYGGAAEIFKTCKSWGAQGPFLGENEPLTSDIPSLIITGKYDPVTPPSYGLQIAKNLSRSYYFEFSNLGHTPTAADTSGCAMDMAVEFLNDPTTEPDHACMNQLEQVKFLVPFTGSPELFLQRKTIKGILVNVPENWIDLEDGFFLRGNSSLDFTQIGILQAKVSAAELKDWFSLGASGYRGLDTAPVNAGQRESNGLTWVLYTATSNSRPVDIAMADYGVNSLVVMMFSHIDERDALYRAAFLPMVDSVK